MLPTNEKTNDLNSLAHEQLELSATGGALSITSQDSGQSTFSTLLNREITQHFAVACGSKA